MILPVLTGAASLSVISALDTLLCARLAESRLGLRLEGNREMYTQGLAFMLSLPVVELVPRVVIASLMIATAI